MFLLQPNRRANRRRLLLLLVRRPTGRNRGRADGEEYRRGRRHESRWDGNLVTIAACYLSPEGVVLGADSASTYETTMGPHHFNYGQKLFEISNSPETGTLGIVTWGMGGLAIGSYRTLIAKLADDLRVSPATSVLDAANRWVELFWAAYTSSLGNELARCHALAAKAPYDQASLDDPVRRTIEEETELASLIDNRFVGFCIGGYTMPSRIPAAFEILFDPLDGKPVPQQLPSAQSLWGVPAMIMRLIKGCGDEIRDAIFNSGFWNGTPEQLDDVIAPHRLIHPSTVPIREAIDFTHACLLTTVKAMKFSPQPRYCGGPIEIAVITTDRPFRWVSHKKWDSAVKETD